MNMSSRDRLIATFGRKAPDMISTYDIMHNIGLMEYLTGREISEKNAEDVACEAVGKVLDLVRHFSIPSKKEPEIVIAKTGLFIKRTGGLSRF
jgi:hypothetical protein